MAQQQRLDVRMGQQLVMTPQLRMAIKLLQMNSQDLQSFVDQEMLENPFLTNEDGDSADTPDTPTNDAVHDAAGDETIPDDTGLDMSWDSMYESGKGASQAAPLGDETGGWEATATEDITLRDHLRQQLGLATGDPVVRFLGYYLIDAVDDAGYIQLDWAQAAKQLGVEQGRLEEVLALIQTFEPTGVGARDLGECLALQLRASGHMDDTMGVILDNLDLLAKRELAKLARMAGVETDDVVSAVERIVALTPKPGLIYGREVASSVVPELIVTRGSDGNWQVELNAEAMPKLVVNRHVVPNFATKDGETRTYVSEKMSRAQWLLKSLEQRAKTIYKVGQAILDLQADFFDHGAESLQPLTLKTVAEAIGSHESTVSRVTSGKYILTPLGMFELKYFFSSAINTTGGNAEVASEGVKAIIRRLLKNEDPSKPFSDEQLVKMLKREGVDVARRTVAKYREAMNIPSSSRRRVRL